MIARAVCRVVAVTLLAAVLVGGALDATASDFVDGLAFVLRAGFVVIGVVACAVCIGLLIDLWVESWKANR